MGAVNHFRHVPALRRGDPTAAEQLGQTIRREIVVAAAVLLLTALLTVLPMPHGDIP
jgi:putative copper export protein